MPTKLTAYNDGILIGFTATATNIGQLAINVDGLGAIPLVHTDGSAIDPGDLIIDTPVLIKYSKKANKFYLVTPQNSLFKAALDAKTSAAIATTARVDAQAAANSVANTVTTVATHVADTAKHLSPAQKTALDQLTAQGGAVNHQLNKALGII